jgi:hypothetical protein
VRWWIQNFPPIFFFSLLLFAVKREKKKILFFASPPEIEYAANTLTRYSDWIIGNRITHR